MSKSDISDFVMQPLHKKLNRENLVSRMEKLEAGESAAAPSARVDALGEIGTSTGRLAVDELLIINHDTGLADAILDQYGLTFRNQEGLVQFLDTNGGGTMTIYGDGFNDLVLENSFGGTGIRFDIDDASHNVRQHAVTYAGFNANAGAYYIDSVQAFPIQNGESVLGSTGFTISSTNFQDTGLNVLLPQAGTYKIHADVRGSLTANGGAGSTIWWLVCELFNATDAAAVANSERMVVLTQVNASNLQMTTHITQTVTVAASKQINLYAMRDGNGTPAWSVSEISSNVAGRTVLSYEKIG